MIVERVVVFLVISVTGVAGVEVAVASTDIEIVASIGTIDLVIVGLNVVPVSEFTVPTVPIVSFVTVDIDRVVGLST